MTLLFIIVPANMKKLLGCNFLFYFKHVYFNLFIEIQIWFDLFIW